MLFVVHSTALYYEQKSYNYNLTIKSLVTEQNTIYSYKNSDGDYGFDLSTIEQTGNKVVRVSLQFSSTSEHLDDYLQDLDDGVVTLATNENYSWQMSKVSARHYQYYLTNSAKTQLGLVSDQYLNIMSKEGLGIDSTLLTTLADKDIILSVKIEVVSIKNTEIPATLSDSISLIASYLDE